MHDLPLSPEDRGTLLRIVREQPPRDRLLAELVFGHGLGVPEALSVRAEDIAWGEDRVKLAAQAGLVQLGSVEGYVSAIFSLVAVPLGAFAASRIAHSAADEHAARMQALHNEFRDRLVAARSTAQQAVAELARMAEE